MDEIFSKFMALTKFSLEEVYNHGWFSNGDIKVVLATFENGEAELVLQKGKEVLELNVWDEVNKRGYILTLNDEYRDCCVKIETEKSINRGNLFTELELLDDYWQKLEAIVNGVLYSTEISIEVELDDNTISKLENVAFNRGITLEALLRNIIIEASTTTPS